MAGSCAPRRHPRTSTSARRSTHWPSSPHAGRPVSPWRITGCSNNPRSCWPRQTETLRLWAETAEKAYREGSDIADALADRFDPLLGDIDAAHKEKLDIMNGVHSNAAGFRRWLEGRDIATTT